MFQNIDAKRRDTLDRKRCDTLVRLYDALGA